MTKSLKGRSRTLGKGFVLGRRGFAKISAVEGVHLTKELEARFTEFDRKGLTAEERRSAIARVFGRGR